MYQKIRPWLFRLDSETAHNASIFAARVGQTIVPRSLESMYGYAHDSLTQQLFGRTFSNPIGLAAGFDKNARLIRFFEAIGCGFVEIGSVTAQPASGNARPRVFRLPEDHALINRMGLNNHGAREVAARLQRSRQKLRAPLGINLAKTPDESLVDEAAIEDYRQSFVELGCLADYVTINISCPNTSDGKTFENAKNLDALLRVIFATRKAQHLSVPILVKLPPTPSPKVVYDSLIEELLSVSLQHGVHGFIATNTSQDRRYLTTSPATIEHIGKGGLSGHPLLERTLQLVRYVHRFTEGKIPIIGVGGIDSSEAAFRMLRAGASLVQIYTGLIYKGPGLIREIKQGLVTLMEEHGHSSITSLIGSDE